MKELDTAKIWKTTLAQIEVKLDSPATYKTFFAGAQLIKLEEGRATIGVPNPFTSDWIQQRYPQLIIDTLSFVSGSPVKLEFVVLSGDMTVTSEVTTESLQAADGKMQTVVAEKIPPLLTLESGISSPVQNLLRTAGLNPKYTLSSFVVGDANRIAHAAATAVCNNPGMVYNPLFIHGPSGVGKTHLAHSIGRNILEREPNSKVVYVASEGFMNEMVKAIKSGKNFDFRNRYRQARVFIIDDVQLISQWEMTRNEFFNTFNELHNNNSQIILIADRRPEDIKDIEDRLRTRFQGGIVVEIVKPDYELRLAILEGKAKSSNITVSRTIMEMLAREITDSIRELEGALQQIGLYNDMKKEGDLTLDEVKRIIGIDRNSKRSQVKVPDILKTIADNFDVKVKDIKGPRRTKELAFARQVCMYVLREEFGYKLEEIAEFLNRQDHTTIMHGVDKVKSLLHSQPSFKDELQRIVAGLNQVSAS